MTTPQAIYDTQPIRDDAAPVVSFESVPAGTRAAVEQLLACDRRDDAKGVQRAMARLAHIMAKGEKG